MSTNSSLFNPTEQAVLDLLAQNLFGAGKSCASFDSFDDVWREAYVQAVPLLAFAGGAPCTSEQDKVKLRANLSTLVTHNSRRIGEHMLIHRLMSEADIPYTIIKGFACSLYYSDPMLRLIGDVDFLVNPQDMSRAEMLLLDNGFERVASIGESHKVFSYHGCRYEMHYEPAGIPSGDVGYEIAQLLKDTVSTSVLKSTVFGTLRVPSDFHHGLIILLHMCHHMNGEGVGLRHLCDWAVFISSFSPEELKADFEGVLKSVGLWSFACVLTKLCIEYLGCSSAYEPEGFTVDATQYLQDILISGNLGQKCDDRAHEALLLSSDSTDSGFLQNLLKSANKIVYKNWPVAKKIKLLLPLGWLFFGLRYAFRSFKGERPEINLKNISRGAQHRKSIYSQLRLFEPEK